jgi:hypothetical protein
MGDYLAFSNASRTVIVMGSEPQTYPRLGSVNITRDQRVER